MIRNYFVMQPFSSKVRPKSLDMTRHSLSRDIYKSLQEIHPYDATIMGINGYTQNLENTYKNI